MKRRLMRPVTAWRRRRAGPLGPHKHAMLEAHDYRPTMNRFLAAARNNPALLFDVELRDGAIVFDVGAYEGGWSEQILTHAEGQGVHALELHLFEPEPNSIERLREKFGSDARVHVYPFGLGGHDRFERMSVGGLGTSPFKKASQPGFFGAVDLEIRDVGDVLAGLALDRIDVMMVNIEGGEYELLDRLFEANWLRRIYTVIIQFHEFGPDAYRSRRRNHQQLAQTHACSWNYKWVYERWDCNTTSDRD
jgi:FkbM family methyltransferase